jgi:hypothetical protein
MEPEIDVKCSILLAKIGLKVATIIEDEDAIVLSKMKKNLPNDLPGTGNFLCDIIKLSDINHIKKILTNNLRKIWLDKWKKQKELIEKKINHLAYNFGYIFKTNKNNSKKLCKCITNIIPHAFGNHSNCFNIGGTWCKSKELSYIPQLFGDKYLGNKLDNIQKNELKIDFQTIIAKFTTISRLQKLAPCGSIQINESIYSVVGLWHLKNSFLEEIINGSTEI